MGKFGCKAGNVEGFEYLSAMRNSKIVWDEKIIEAYVTRLKNYLSDNKMVFAGLKMATQHADPIAYIKEQQK